MEDKGMLTGNLWKAIPLFAFPVAATSILEQLSSLIATVVIGQVPGPEGTLGMAAVGANTPIMSLILNLFIGISLGTNVVIANAIGKGDQQTVTRAVHTSVLMSLIGFAVVIIGEIYAEALLTALSVPLETLPTAALFLRVYLLGMPSILLYNFEAAIFRSVGITRMPLQALMVSTVVNVGLDLVFVSVLHWGVAGLAAASAIAYTLSAATLFYRLTTTDSPVRLDPRKLRVDGAVLARIVRIGLPAGLQSAVFALANTIIQAGINSLGTEVMAASSAAMSLEYVFYNLLNSFSQACATFVGQNYGAGQVKRCRKILGLCILEDAIATASAIFIILFAGKFVLALFNPDPQVIDIGYSRLLIVFTAYVFSMLYEVMSGYLRGFGISLAPALLVIFGVCGIRILWISFVFPVKRTFSTILYVYPISLATTALLIGIALLVFRPSKRLAGQAQNADSASAT